MDRAYALRPAEGDHILMLGTDIRVLAGQPTNASFSFLAIDLPAGQGPPPHVHDQEDEAFYVLEGRMRFKAGKEEWVLSPGGFVYLPRGVVHQPMVEGDQPAKALAILSRPGIETFFAAFVRELESSGGPPSLELLDKVGAAYGLRHFTAVS